MIRFRSGVISAAVAALFCGAVFAGCFRPPMTCDREAMYETIEALCADSMAGRRAASGGDLRAARMLAGMMEKAGCKPLWEEAVVPFHLENTMKALHT